MVPRRRTLSLGDPRSVLATRGDLEIGAFARRARRRRLGIALGGVALIVAAGLVFYFLGEPADSAAGDAYRVAIRCITCGYSSDDFAVRTTQSFPMACPGCKELSCKQVWQCRRCGNRFVPPAAFPVVCPATGCGSSNVGTGVSKR